ncbi:MAG: aldo/keto reductase [Hafnia sp.]|jgi:predicted oxidoreductase|uniref:Aldo-keto reductase family oxidoreductase n=1 Tax=Obesumbacterium proteus ATCC 12841 TaxID=1354268 RepID=A0AA91EA37_9GAMM|nr:MULTISPECIES: aldo/keto reductase [Hafniaceae]AMO81595.1 aldo/keto reductase [Obesumbacterium proteus]KKI47070.1 aldo/keto reductase [Obesumbacterium proteus]MCE9883497.1 aldo/keto reductase [Obesumbacterium proteus]MCE9916043.1 aldo/keto reductase [Obesumbacterium proteus]MCE9928595.1 aldo/keto reductase [Obesumbacterium proteus]
MKQIKLGGSTLHVPAIVVGCMRMDELKAAEAETFVQTALDLGANFFDHADIYGGGECERIFARAAKLNDDRREKVFLQSKCGIRKGLFDFSKEHILKSVDGILERLDTDYLDMLLVHRPDALMEPEEVAEAFDHLLNTGKVRRFGVSNQSPMQMALLQKFMSQKILANQLQLSITNSGMIRSGINVNMENASSVDHDGEVLNYCRLNDVTIQAWSPFQYGMFEGVFLGNPKFPELNQKIDEIAARYGVSNTTITTAWILRHPANMQMISGTMSTSRLKQICQACDITLTREEWYEIYRAAGNELP